MYHIDILRFQVVKTLGEITNIVGSDSRRIDKLLYKADVQWTRSQYPNQLFLF